MTGIIVESLVEVNFLEPVTQLDRPGELAAKLVTKCRLCLVTEEDGFIGTPGRQEVIVIAKHYMGFAADIEEQSLDQGTGQAAAQGKPGKICAHHRQCLLPIDKGAARDVCLVDQEVGQSGT